MNRARRRKGSFQKARDKVEKREEVLHQGMAIRGIDNREKKKHKEENKSIASSEKSIDLASSTNFTDKSAPQDEKTNPNGKDTPTIPEVFDSSKYDSMTEMKKSANMKEGGHLKEVLSSVEKDEPIEPTTTTDTRPSNMDTNSLSAAANATADASPPNLEKRAATLRGSKEEQIVDKNLEDSKDKSLEEVIEVKDKEADVEPYLSQKVADPYTIFWRDAAKTWNDFYIEYTRNASEITRYWSELFSKSWLFGYKRKKQ
jgi:hypothetical protein